MNCYHCGSVISDPTKRQRDMFNRCARSYCNRECAAAATSIMSSVRMAETNRKYASARMKMNNPMSRLEAREKMTNTLKAIGHAPIIRGGNGQGMTRQQKALLEKIGTDIALSEYCVRLGKMKPGYPTNYKVDIGIPESRIAVEIDGNSHLSIERQRQDAKKDEKLISLGWRVFRFSNNDVDENIDFCARMVGSEIRRRGRVIESD